MLKFFIKTIGVIFVAALILLFLINIKSSEDFYKKEFSEIKKLKLSKVELPIKTKKGAAIYILQDEEVIENIQSVRERGWKKWQVESYKIKDLWSVKIQSLDYIPSYICYFKFDKDGNFEIATPWDGCQFAK